MRVHDRRAVAEGASGRNGGFALRRGARYDVARETYGAEQARALWRWTRARSTGWRSSPATRCGGRQLPPRRRRGGAREHPARSTRRCTRTASTRSGSRSSRAPPGFHGAISSPRRRLHPARALRRAARVARRRSGRGVSRARSGRRRRGSSTPSACSSPPTATATVSSRARRRDLAGARTSGGERAARRVLYDRPHYARQGFDYWQQLPDRRLLLGGFRDVSIMDELTDVEETTPTIRPRSNASSASSRAARRASATAGPGSSRLTQDMLPLVGAVPGRDGGMGSGRVLRARKRHGFGCGSSSADAMLGRDSRSSGCSIRRASSR